MKKIIIETDCNCKLKYVYEGFTEFEIISVLEIIKTTIINKKNVKKEIISLCKDKEFVLNLQKILDESKGEI